VKKLVIILGVLLFVSVSCLVSIVASSVGEIYTTAESTIEDIAKNESHSSKKLADGDACVLSYGQGTWDAEAGLCVEFVLNTETPLPPTAVPVIPTAEPTEDILNIAYLLQAWDYFDSLGILADALIDDIMWITENLQIATDLEDIYALCALGEVNMSEGIEALRNLDPTDDLEVIHAMYLAGFGEWRQGMQACQAEDIVAFAAHTEAGLALVSTANDLVDIWEP